MGGVDARGWEIIGFSVVGSDRTHVEATVRDAARSIASGEGDYTVGREWWTVEEVDLGDIGGLVP
jgi:uncharacterized protein YlxP (DUF503 family)